MTPTQTRRTPPVGTTIRYLDQPPTGGQRAAIAALGGRCEPTTTGWKAELPAGITATTIAKLL